MENVCTLVRDMEANYVNGVTTISKYVSFDMYETINKIDAYINSVHISGSQDALGRDKPFYNIVTATRNIWYRATDIDRKHIRVRTPQASLTVETFIANVLLKKWMRKSGFGVFLNEWGRTEATYGSAVLKFIEKDGELHSSVIPWNRIVCDPIDFENNIKVEVLEFTPAQLKRQKGYNQEMVKELLKAVSEREDLNKQKKDSKSGYIKVYEVHGEMSLATYKDSKGEEVKEGDEDIYKQQMHVISFVKNGRGKSATYKDFTLYSGFEKHDPYMITHLIKEDGRALSIGAVEHLFEAQWMVNHTAKQIKDTLDFASLLILQTADVSLVGTNVLSSLVTGDVLIHTENNPLTQLNNQHDITQIQAFSQMWQNIAKEQSATPDAIRGNTQPSGTAYRLQQLITNEAHSLFEIMTENRGLDIEKMMRLYILPYLKTQMDTTEEIVEVLDSDSISEFDSMYVPNVARRRNNEQIKKAVLSGQIAESLDLNQIQNDVKEELTRFGNKRPIKPSEIKNKTWKDILKDFEWEVEVDVTHESEDIDASLTTLSSTFQTIASMAGRPMTDDERIIFNTIMEKSGTVSPLQLSRSKPVQPPTGGGGSNVQQPNKINQPIMA